MPERLGHTPEYLQPCFEAEIVNPSEETWSAIKDRIVAIEKENFGEKGYKEQQLKMDFLNPANTWAVIKDEIQNQVEGYTYAIPDEDEPKGETAYIEGTAIATEHQGKKLVAKLMAALESELIRRGYKFMTRDASIPNRYADKVSMNYADRITVSRDHESQYGFGPQRYFKIKLMP